MVYEGVYEGPERFNSTSEAEKPGVFEVARRVISNLSVAPATCPDFLCGGIAQGIK